jgi:hypothetical protein
MLTSSVTKSGTFNIAQTLRLSGTGAITVPAATDGNNLTINVTGDFVMETGTKISGDVTGTSAADGTGATIVIDATGNISLQGATTLPLLDGAKITSTQTAGSCTGGKGGSITLQADGNITTENGSELRVDAKCPAGEIIIQAGADTFIDGVVSSKSGQSGAGANLRPGGGPITITGACDTTISDNAVVSSRGQDPGSDLVHIEGGCLVKIFGYVESTNGHGVPDNPPNHCGTFANRPHPGLSEEPTGCIEIWSGGPLFIDRKSHKGELSTDPAQQGGLGSAWIDIFALGDISISGPSSGADPNCQTLSPYAVHTNQLCVNKGNGGIVTVKSTAGSVTATGKAIQANGLNSGGEITMQAKNDVELNAADLTASGRLGSGGAIAVRTFTGALNWQNGVGDVRPDGSIDLEGCTAVSTSGSSFPAGAPTTQTGSCGSAPQLPSYVTLPQCSCLDILVTKTCDSVTVSPDGTKFIIKFSGTATNQGQFTLNNVTITDDPSAQFMPPLLPQTLAAGATASFAGSYEATAIPGNVFSDTITVTGTGPSGKAFKGKKSADCPPFSVSPQITVTKLCTNTTTPLGQPVKFKGQVCNPGDEQLINVTVTDTPPADNPPGIKFTPNVTVLAPKGQPGECLDYEGQHTPNPPTSGLLKDTVTAQGTGILSRAVVMDTASANCKVVQPKLSVELNGDCPLINLKQTVEFNGQVCNDGNENLKNVKVIINKPQANTQLVFPTTLAKGTCQSFEHTYLPPPLKDSATVTVTAVGASSNLPVSAQDNASYECPIIPPDVSITVTTACQSPATRLGSPINYTGEICNVEDAVNKLSLVSNRPKGNTPIKLSTATLGTGQCLPYKGSYRSSTSGLLEHTVTATASSSIDNTVVAQADASATCAVGQSCLPANWISLAPVNGWYKYKGTQRVGAIFSGANTTSFTALANLTLLQALGNKTLKTALQTAAAQLIKEAITALLNAAHPNVKYPIKDTQTIINQVNAALMSKNLATIQALTQTYNSYNLLGGAPAICEAAPPC